MTFYQLKYYFSDDLDGSVIMCCELGKIGKKQCHVISQDSVNPRLVF
jgi:hypothetical protein